MAPLLDTPAQIQALINKIEEFTPKYPFLFIDLEGVNLSRDGSVSIMQILVAPDPTVYLLDVHLLQNTAFETATSTGTTLKDILESALYPKVFFDVRSDSDALYAHYGINLKCVVDLQLLEFVTRPYPGEFLSGLSKCIEKDLSLGYTESMKASRIKSAGKALFAPEVGGSYEVFNERPLRSALVDYCVQDVKLMPDLLMEYAKRLSRHAADQVSTETATRVQRSQSSVPFRKGPHMARGPMLFNDRSRDAQSLKHPMNIVYSSQVREYCQLRSLPIAASDTTGVTVLSPAATDDGETNTASAGKAVSLVSMMPNVKAPYNATMPNLAAITSDVQAPQLLRPSKKPDFIMRTSASADNHHDGYHDEEMNHSFETLNLSDHDFAGDFTACSADDCGYCGRCSY